MTRTRVLISCTVAMLAVGVLAAPLAGAAQEPRLLEASDLPGRLEAVGEPATQATVFQFAIDPALCTQTYEDDPTATEATLVQFQVPKTKTGAVSESVISYPNAKTAKAAFDGHAATAQAGQTCGTVDVLAGGKEPVATITYGAVDVPKIGGGAYGVSRGPGSDPATAAIQIEVLSGKRVVVLTTFGNGAGPTQRQLAKVARRAERLARTG